MTEPNPQLRPFAEWLLEQSSGSTHDELSEGLHDLVSRVKDTGKKGTLTLVVTVAPMKEDQEVLVVSDEIKLKLPEFARKASIFYADGDGNLTRKNPNQMEFDFLRELPSGPTPDQLKDTRP